MIIYNVTLSISPNIHENWLQWMRHTHIPEVMQTGVFVQHRIFRLAHPEPEDGTYTYAVQYACKNMEALNEYIDAHSPRLQKKHNELFAGEYTAFRSILEEIT